MNRREFMTTVAAAAVTLPITGMAKSDKSRLRVGLIGTGMRGRVHLKELLRRDDVDVAALCDVESFAIDAALAMVSKAGRRKPAVYSGSDRAYETLLSKGGLDAVIISTPWEWHAPQAIAAMQSKVAVGCEVVAGISLDDHWQVLRAQQRTNVPYMLLENVCYRRDVMAVLNMVRQGMFGEIVHMEAGYQHDLRAVKFNSGDPGKPYGGGVEFGEKGFSEARWRTPHSVRRNGELYPSHGIGPCAMWANINRGNRLLRLSSYASKARGLHNYIVKNGGAAHPNASVRFSLGDVVTTQIACAGGETITLTHDTSLPRPYSLGFRVQGTEGLWMDVNESLYLEGRSPKPHEWEPAGPWLEKNDHPLWKRYAAQAEGAGHGGMDFFVVHAFVEALKAKAPMPIDIYDAVTWSAITPLSEMSIADNNRTVDFPDFTGDAWAGRKPIFAFGDTY
ncbi:Gfo/Idh/MocA family protein [Tahibacter amnicola]|uniref:Gfo/Idh/MocA family oxidoreductase n=1 Tax=Tahibacter amnicola TaxID=2976241 RepID=A0ABY6BAL7_9GAMM|nr:Gfo/Idh/MocA family oxidoreductase [Tahibacter amnicola]UXI66900.1 Gfo/Idh/MocA family oxidoreductase [Tahibacter amnicola]